MILMHPTCACRNCPIHSAEAQLRSGDECEYIAEAQLSLCERTALVPNDAQSWRRLASVFGRRGLEDHAKVAHYTAWQLGIGQGGFGGAK
jgi:Flp pilus assembly protein TadD